MSLDRIVIQPKNPQLNVSRNRNLPHSPGIRAGDLVFLSGMVSIDPNTGRILTGTMAEETRTVLSNMTQMLEAAGTSLKNAVKMTVNISDESAYAEMNQVYREFFTQEDPPACSVNAVTLSFGLKIEIECIAVVPRRAGEGRP